MRHIRYVLIPAVLFLLAGIVLPSFAQQTWQRTYGTVGEDMGYSVFQTSDGGFVVSGSSNYFTNEPRVYLIKTNAYGDTLWTRNYGGNVGEEGWSVQQTSDAGYIIAGYTYSFGAGLSDVYLIKTDSLGDTLWTRTFGGPNYDYGYSVQQTSDGGYIVAGTTQSFGAGLTDVYLIKTNASGDTLWTRTYGGTNYDAGFAVQQTADGGYIVTGYVDGGDVYLVKTNASGDTLWTRSYDRTGFYQVGKSVKQTSNGGYIIAGFTGLYSTSWDDVLLIKTDSLGDTLWTHTYGDTIDDEGFSVRQTSDGGYIVAGGFNSVRGGGGDVWLIKTNASGDTLWTKTFGGPYSDLGYSVQQTSDRGYIIVGYTNSFGAGMHDVYLIKTDSLGNVGVETNTPPHPKTSTKSLTVIPNPFVSFTSVPNHEAERFSLYDVSGRRVGTYKGDRIGEGLRAGVFFMRPEGKDGKPVRVVKVR
jgi:hypothetical protein